VVAGSESFLSTIAIRREGLGDEDREDRGMKLSNMKHLLARADNPGYRVSFEVREGFVRRSDHVPECNEEPFITESEAWEFARRMDKCAPKNFVNIYVVSAADWSPVTDYRERMYRCHPG
jgi:hypothetical protein